MKEFLQGLVAIAAPTIQVMILMAWSCALYWFMVTFVTVKAAEHDPGGWLFAGPLTLSIAGLIVGATFGIGKAHETLTAPGMGLALSGILTSVVGTLLLHKASNKWAERPAGAKTTVTTTATPVADPPPAMVVEKVVERAGGYGGGSK